MLRNTKKQYGFIKCFSILVMIILLTSTSIVFFVFYKAANSLIHIKNEKPIHISLNPNEYLFEEVTFTSQKDDLILKGTFFSAKESSNKTLVVVHGFNENRLMSGRTETLVKYFVPRGYNVLAFDLRGQGLSEGNLISFGYFEKYDVCGAIDYLKQRDGVGEKIAIIGFSMGAVTAIEAAGMDVRVDALIADSPFNDLEKFITNDFNNLLSELSDKTNQSGEFSYCSVLRYFPFNKAAAGLIAKRYDVNIDEISPIEAVKEISEKPIFLIHGKEDKIIPYANSEKIYDAIKKNVNAQFWFSEKAGHIQSINMYSHEYLEKLEIFLNGHM